MRAALLWLLCATVCCSSSLSSSPTSSSSSSSASSSSSSSSSSKPQVTRTALHVARSLDPAAMETLTVKTRTGDVATLLVKKREGRHGQQSADLGLKSADSPGGSRENTVYEKISVGAPYQADLKSGETRSQSSSEQKNLDHNSTRSSKSSPLVPDPVYVRSTPMLVKGKSQYGHLFSAKRGRSLVKIDADGIPVVTGVRVPDDESDKQVWRNARVINGVLMPYDKNQPKHTFSLPATTPYPEKKKVHPGQQSQASWVKMEPITKPAPTLLKPIIKEPLPAAIKVHTSASNKVHPSASSWQQSASDSPSASSWQQSASDSPMTVVQGPSQEWQANKYSQDVVKVIDDSQPNLPEEDKYLRDRILDYIKSVNKQEVKRVPVLAPFRDSRGLTHSDVTHFSTSDVIVPPVEGEARMLHASPSDALPLEARMLHASPSDALPMEARNAEALPMEARMLHASSEALPMEARMLQVPGASVYPTSIMYSSASSSVIGPDGATRVTSVEEGVRTPVLQYAHPELGVQPAVPEAESRVRVAVDEQFEDHPAGGRDQALAYFSHDIHADRSPFAFEPGLEDEARVPPVAPTPLVERQHSQRSHSPPAPRPKKIDPPHALINSHQFYITERPSGNLKYYSKYPEALVYSGNVVDNRDRPFWERIGDTIREHVQTGVDKMTEMTRPVMEPLVEATQKISHNLGLGTDREMHSFKDKLGVVGTPSVFLPALGLVAGGAALGLGAVAVGRYLDVDMLKRSGAGDAEIERLQLEHKRALEALDRGHTEVSGRGHDGLAQKPTLLYPSASPATQLYSSASPATNSDDAAKKLRRRRRRDVLQHVDQHVDDTESNLLRAGLGDASLWSDTPCAKRTFCQVMLSQPGDDVFLMEKKMGAFLAMLPQSSRGVLGVHLDDVMSAVRSRDCSVFLCNQFDVKHIPIPR